MKEAEAKLLIESGVITKAVFYRSPSIKSDWDLWLYGDNTPASINNRIDLARGGGRTWASLDTGHEWLKRLCGKMKIQIEIDG